MKKPKFEIGQEVYVVGDSHVTGGRYVTAIRDGCDCCDTYRTRDKTMRMRVSEPEPVYFYEIDYRRYHTDNYLFLTLEEAEDSLKKQKEFYERIVGKKCETI